MPDTEEILKERGRRYGEFAAHAHISQSLKATCFTVAHDGWCALPDAHREALEMIFHKIARVLNGDPNYDDSWEDIAGYAKLVAKICRKEGL